MLEPLIKGVWAELSESARQRQTDVLFWAIHTGIPVDEMEERINASDRTQLLTAFALNAAARTAWEDKVRTLGRSLAAGLLADDNAKIDTEQMIIAAITDIEGPQLALLEFVVCWEPGRQAGGPRIEGPLDVPDYSHSRSHDKSWQVNERKWNIRQIAFARPNLAPITPSLLGTLQWHGLVVQNDNTSEAIERHQEALERAIGRQRGRSGVPRVNRAGDLAPDPTWSTTELGEQVFLRFRDSGTELEDVWTCGPADQQE